MYVQENAGDNLNEEWILSLWPDDIWIGEWGRMVERLDSMGVEIPHIEWY